MGYWAKDGAYVHDDDDIKVSEQMNETQKQYHERVQAGIEYSTSKVEEEKRIAQARREYEAKSRQEELEYEKSMAEERQQRFTTAMEQQKIYDNKMKYGTDFDLRNPHSLADRRARANFWRTNSSFRMFVDKITKKDEKFHNLWNQFNSARTEEERLQIVEQMEKMYPTKESAIRAVEKKARTGR